MYVLLLHLGFLPDIRCYYYASLPMPCVELTPLSASTFAPEGRLEGAAPGVTAAAGRHIDRAGRLVHGAVPRRPGGGAGRWQCRG